MEIEQKSNKFQNLISDEVSKVHDIMDYRISNRDWLKKSMRIAVKINSEMRIKSINKEDLMIALGTSMDDIDLILKGHKNMTLEEICKIEKFLNIELI